MKFALITPFMVLMVCTSVTISAQTSTIKTPTMKTAEAQKQSWSVSYEMDNEKIATKINPTHAERDVAYYDYVIEAMEIKKEFVLNNPEEKAIAEASGWLELIDKNLAKARAKREELLKN